MVSTRSNIKKKIVEQQSKMSYEEAYKLCKAKRLEIKLHRVKIPVPSSDKRIYCNEVEAPAKKMKHKSDKKTIESMIETKKKAAEAYEEKFNLTKNQLYYVAGKCCSNVKRVESIYGVTLLVDEPAFKNGGQSQVVVKGPSTESVSAAKTYILDNLPRTLSFPLQERFVARVRGRKGETVRRLQKEFGVLVSLDDGKVFIAGMKDRTEAAREAINCIISGKRKRSDDSDTELFAKRIRKPTYLLWFSYLSMQVLRRHWSVW